MNLADTLRAALARDHGGALELLPGDGIDDAGADPLTPAAVLVAVVDRPRPGVLLTVRPDTMRRHPGQIAFPGGRIDPDDDGPVAAALREAEEEIALPPAAVEVIGVVDRYRTVTGFEVVPVLAVVPPDLPLMPHAREVADLFEAPLGFLLDPANQMVREAEWRGRRRSFYQIDWEGRRIWGATAAMLVNLGRRLGLAP